VYVLVCTYLLVCTYVLVCAYVRVCTYLLVCIMYVCTCMYLSNTALFDGRYMYRICYIRYNYMFRRLTVAILLKTAGMANLMIIKFHGLLLTE